MQMQAMNNYGRGMGFGGQPQPQRQGGRRGNRGGGGFRQQSRFDHNNQRHQNQGQRPNENKQDQGNNQQQGPNNQQGANQQRPGQNQPPKTNQQSPQNQPRPGQSPQNQPRPGQSPQNQPRPGQSPQNQQRPNQNNQNQQNRPNNQNNQNQPRPNPISNQPRNAQPQQNQAKPQEAAKPAVAPQPAATESKDKVDTVKEQPQPQKIANANAAQADNQTHPQQKMNGGNFANKQGGTWAQGAGPNKQGFGNKQFGGPKFGGGAGQGGPGPMRHRQQGGRPPMQNDGQKPGQREEHILANKLKDLAGPILDLPPLDNSEVKFNGRSRLYIGNLTNDVTEEEILNMFGAFGEAAELFVNKEKNFGFIKMDYRMNAEKAKRELDGKMCNGRTLRVRFAPHNSAIRVKNLPAFVTNELLYRAFDIFGKIERAYVRVDERGKSLGEGVVEYARKPSALAAIRHCTEKCYFLTASLRPVIVESFEEPDEFDGYPEKNLPKKHPEFMKAREVGPRFSELNSFEHEYGTRWKQLHELHRQKEEALKKELEVEEQKLEAQMEFAKYEHETEILREQLRQREQDRERQKRSWEQVARAADERRDQDRAERARHEGELELRMRAQDDELRRRQQENTLFVQAQRLNSMLDRQEQGMFDSHQSQPMDGGFRDQFDMGRGFDDMQGNRGWEGPRQNDDYPNKRRRF